MPISSEFSVADSPYPRGARASEAVLTRLESLPQGYMAVFFVSIVVAAAVAVSGTSSGPDNWKDSLGPRTTTVSFFLFILSALLYFIAFRKVFSRWPHALAYALCQGALIGGWCSMALAGLGWVLAWIAVVCFAAQAMAVADTRELGLKGRLPLYSRLKFRAVAITAAGDQELAK